MGSGQSKPINNSRTCAPQNDSLLSKPNKFSTIKPTYRLKSMSLRERNVPRTSSQSDASPGYSDEQPLRIGTKFIKSPAGNSRRGYNSYKEPINRKYPWRGGNEKAKTISLLPKQHSLKPWGPIKGYITSDGSSNSPNESFGDEALKARDAQSRFCHEIHERHAAMTEAEKRRRLEAIKALENKLQYKSGVSAPNNADKRSSSKIQDFKSQSSSNCSFTGILKKAKDCFDPIRNSQIHTWRVEHFSNFDRHRSSSGSKTVKTKLVSDRCNEAVRNAEKDVKEVDTGYGKIEVAGSGINTIRNCKRRSKAQYVNRMYNYSRLNTLMASGGNYSQVKGRTGKGIIYPRQTNKAVFLLLKTFADRSPSPRPTRHIKSGNDASVLCDKSTTVSKENLNFSYKSVETQTTPVHVSRKISLDSAVQSKIDNVPKLEVNHRGSLTRHVSSTPSIKATSNNHQVVLGYSHGVTIDTRKRDNVPQRNSIREKRTIDDCQSNAKLVARGIVAENIRQKYAVREKESIDDRLNNEKFVGRRKAPENGRQRVIAHEIEYVEGRSDDDKLVTGKVAPNNTVRVRPQNGPFSADTHKHLCYNSGNNNSTEFKSNWARIGRNFAKERFEERDRLPQRAYGPPNPAKSYQTQTAHHKTDTAKEEYYRTQLKRCRIPVPTQHRNDTNDDPASPEKRIAKMDSEAASIKENVGLNSEDYKYLCKMPLDVVNGSGDTYVPDVNYELKNSSSTDDESEDVERLLCGRRKLCRHWGKNSVSRCNICRERICYDIKEDEEDSENSQRIT